MPPGSKGEEVVSPLTCWHPFTLYLPIQMHHILIVALLPLPALLLGYPWARGGGMGVESENWV